MGPHQQAGISRAGTGELRQHGQAQNCEVLGAFSPARVQVSQCLAAQTGDMLQACNRLAEQKAVKGAGYVHRALFVQSSLCCDFAIRRIVFL